MADRNFHDYRARRDDVLKPSNAGDSDLYRPGGWPLKTFAERRTLADHVFREYATLRKLRPKTRSDSLLALHRKALFGVATYQDKIRKMGASERSVGTMTEETFREKGTALPPPNLPAEPELLITPHDCDEAQAITTSPEGIAAVAKSPKFKDGTSQAQSGNECAEQAKKRSSGRSLRHVLKGAMKKLGLRRDASR